MKSTRSLAILAVLTFAVTERAATASDAPLRAGDRVEAASVPAGHPHVVHQAVHTEKKVRQTAPTAGCRRESSEYHKQPPSVE